MTEPTTAPRSPVEGCTIAPIDKEETCFGYLDWLNGQQNPPASVDTNGLSWALAHCDEGVTWGRFDEPQSSWRLGSQAVPEVSPAVRKETIQELRLFGEHSEVLIWRTEKGLRGRILRELSPPADRENQSDPLRPSDERRILRGDRVLELREGFSRVDDRTGAEQVLPVEVAEQELRGRRARLHVRHYWEQSSESGVVRIAATRLVDLKMEASHAT